MLPFGIYIYILFIYLLAQMKKNFMVKRNKEHNPKASGRKIAHTTKGHKTTEKPFDKISPPKRRLMCTPYASIWPASST
jgi:hypothetical protein